jgi:hypothetical protein
MLFSLLIACAKVNIIFTGFITLEGRISLTKHDKIAQLYIAKIDFYTCPEKQLL